MKNIKEAIVLSLGLTLILPVSVTLAAPQGAQVVGGGADIRQNGAATVIDQKSDRAVINWHSFDIGRHEAVRHNMPSASSAGLHRVVGGGGASQIQGLLQSNGNIYLVNPAGVVIHKGAKVDTNGFIATTRDIADSNFMKGKMVFDKPGLAGAQIINKGEITVKDSGLAALVAPSVRNEGLIAAKLGKVALAAGEGSWSLDMHGDDLITFTVDENAVNNLHGADGKPLASVENSGSIKAEGGVVVLTAAQLDGIVGSVVNSGEISAASAEISGGMITFKGQGSGVDISNTGTLDVSSAVADAGSVRMDTDGKLSSSGSIAATGGKKGGKVTLTGQDVVLKGSAKIDASGNTGGGTVLVGGNALGKGPERNAKTTKVESGTAIHADAKIKGDGGQVVVWSDDKTSFDGTITAKGGSEDGNGGHVETSGAILKIGSNAQVSTLAPKGLYGKWLLDPKDFVIAADGDMPGGTISASLENTDIEIKSDLGGSGTNGDIIIDDTISWSSNNTLTLNAKRNIYVNNNIISSGNNSSLIIITENGDIITNGSSISFSSISSKLNINGNEYILIDNISDLQKISDSGYYAIGKSFDASDTKEWNNRSGFDPIETFSGILNGLGNTITGLYINRPTERNVGVFKNIEENGKILNINLYDCDIFAGYGVGSISGTNSGYINNFSSSGSIKTTYILGLSNPNITGQIIGGIVGRNDGKIYNSYSNSTVTGVISVGGLVGLNAGTIYNSHSNGKVLAVTGDIGDFGNHSFGGLVGRNSGTISNSYSNSNVIGIEYTGGLVGSNASNAEIKNSYSTGNVSGEKSVGGFAGLNYGVITNSYSTSKVSGNSSVGGFIGAAGANSEILNSYWDIETSEISQSAGGIGLTTAQMKTRQSYTGWDFTNTWFITEGVSYPQFVASVSGGGTGGGTTDPGTGGGTTDPGTGGGTTDPGTGGGTTDPGTGGGTTVPGTGGGGMSSESGSVLDTPFGKFISWMGNIKDNVIDFFTPDKNEEDQEYATKTNGTTINNTKEENTENLPKGDWCFYIPINASSMFGEIDVDIADISLDVINAGIEDSKQDILNFINSPQAGADIIVESLAETILDQFGGPGSIVSDSIDTIKTALSLVKKGNFEPSENIKNYISLNDFSVPTMTKIPSVVENGIRETSHIVCNRIGENRYIYTEITVYEVKTGLFSWSPSSLNIKYVFNAPIQEI